MLTADSRLVCVRRNRSPGGNGALLRFKLEAELFFDSFKKGDSAIRIRGRRWTHSVYDVDGPSGDKGTGHLWNRALRAGLLVRGYGVFARVYNLVHPKPEVLASDGRAISPQSIAAYEDPNWPVPEWVKPIPDFYRIREWRREFEEFSRKGSAPSLMVTYLPPIPG